MFTTDWPITPTSSAQVCDTPGGLTSFPRSIGVGGPPPEGQPNLRNRGGH
ncbi:hypothetical protein F750_0997 [Streptomyces sp. PAMC 26508]|nr:hypothetical protein F750_0997 [Streptomyces sp. PAMC 26508]